MKKPGKKHCENCGSVVYPQWHKIHLSEEYGWIGASFCSSCGHSSIHCSGSPWFIFVFNGYTAELKSQGLI